MGLKLDTTKAYDLVKWSFLDEMMKCIGFRDRWRWVLIECITTTWFPFIANGIATGRVIP